MWIDAVGPEPEDLVHDAVGVESVPKIRSTPSSTRLVSSTPSPSVSRMSGAASRSGTSRGSCTGHRPRPGEREELGLDDRAPALHGSVELGRRRTLQLQQHRARRRRAGRRGPARAPHPPDGAAVPARRWPRRAITAITTAAAPSPTATGASAGPPHTGSPTSGIAASATNATRQTASPSAAPARPRRAHRSSGPAGQQRQPGRRESGPSGAEIEPPDRGDAAQRGRQLGEADRVDPRGQPVERGRQTGGQRATDAPARGGRCAPRPPGRDRRTPPRPHRRRRCAPTPARRAARRGGCPRATPARRAARPDGPARHRRSDQAPAPPPPARSAHDCAGPGDRPRPARGERFAGANADHSDGGLLRLGHQPGVTGARGQEDQPGAEERGDPGQAVERDQVEQHELRDGRGHQHQPGDPQRGPAQPAGQQDQRADRPGDGDEGVARGEAGRRRRDQQGRVDDHARRAVEPDEPDRHPDRGARGVRADPAEPTARHEEGSGESEDERAGRDRGDELGNGRARWRTAPGSRSARPAGCAAIQPSPPSTSAVIIANRLRSPTASNAATRASPRTARTAGEPSRPTTVAVSRAVTAATPAATLTARAPGQHGEDRQHRGRAAREQRATPAAERRERPPVRAAPPPRRPRRPRRSTSERSARSTDRFPRQRDAPGPTSAAPAGQQVAGHAERRCRPSYRPERLRSAAGAAARSRGSPAARRAAAAAAECPSESAIRAGRCGCGRTVEGRAPRSPSATTSTAAARPADGEHTPPRRATRVHPVQHGARPRPAASAPTHCLRSTTSRAASWRARTSATEQPAVGQHRGRAPRRRPTTPPASSSAAPPVGEAQAGPGDDQREQQGGDAGQVVEDRGGRGVDEVQRGEAGGGQRERARPRALPAVQPHAQPDEPDAQHRAERDPGGRGEPAAGGREHQQQHDAEQRDRAAGPGEQPGAGQRRALRAGGGCGGSAGRRRRPRAAYQRAPGSAGAGRPGAGPGPAGRAVARRRPAGASGVGTGGPGGRDRGAPGRAGAPRSAARGPRRRRPRVRACRAAGSEIGSRPEATSPAARASSECDHGADSGRAGERSARSSTPMPSSLRPIRPSSAASAASGSEVGVLVIAGFCPGPRPRPCVPLPGLDHGPVTDLDRRIAAAGQPLVAIDVQLNVARDAATDRP